MNYKYYVIYTSNGVLQLDKITEWSDLSKAKVAYFDKCKVLENTKEVIDGIVELIYSEDMNVVSDGGTTFRYHISHPQEETEE